MNWGGAAQRQQVALEPSRLEGKQTIDTNSGLAAPIDLPLEAEPVQHLGRPARDRFRDRLLIADASTVLVGGAIGFLIWVVVRDVGQATVFEHMLLFVLSYPVWIASLMVAKLYRARVVTRRSEEFRRIWAACSISIVIIVTLVFGIGYERLSRAWVALLLVSIATLLIVERAVARRIFAKLRTSGQISRRIAVIGNDPHAFHIAQTLQANSSLGYSVAGFIGDFDIHPPDFDRLGPVSHADTLLTETGCSGAIISLASIDASEVNHLVRRLTDRGFHIALSSSLHDIDMARVRPQSLDGRTLLYIEPVIRDGWRARAKRGFDVSLAVVASILSAPLVLAAAALIKLDSRGPVFFHQKRVGRNGEHFEMLKLRTMSVDAEQRLEQVMDQNERTGPLFKVARDPRITRVGRILRNWSIDEIPQFYNVLRGDMSVVGPRPALPSEVADWDEEVKERLRALPGITGLWQVEGRGNESFDVYKRLDLLYVDNWSLLHDLLIVWRTFGAVIARRGAF